MRKSEKCLTLSIVRGYRLVIAVFFSALPFAAAESRSPSFTNISIDAGYASPPAIEKAASSSEAVVTTVSVPAPQPPPRRLRLLAGAGLLFGAAALMMRRRTRRQSNEVLAVAAHELKSPLAALESYLALMEQEGKSGAAADTRAWLEDVAHMRSTAAHLRRSISEILEMTSLDDGRIKLERRALDLADSARETTAAFQALASEAGIKLKLSAAPAPAWGDPTRVRQILDNLVANALRHSPDSGTVTVSTGSDDGGRAWCTVVDEGKGVPQAQRARLFTRFASLSVPLRGEPGSGLGLYIGRKLALAQRGELGYESGPSARGGRFRLTLPRAGRA